MWNRLRLRFAVLALVGVLAGCDDSEPSRYTYFVDLDTYEHHLDGAALFRGDETLGIVIFPYDAARPRVEFELPAEAWLTDPDAPLSLRFPTPCGLSHPIPIQLETTRELEAERREYLAHGRVDMSASAPSPGDSAIPAASRFWLDPAEREPRTFAVGEVEVEARPGELPPVRGLDCGPSHSVRIDGTEVGEISANTPSVEARRILEEDEEDDRPAHYFVTADPSACYRWRRVVYDMTPDAMRRGGAPEPVSFGGRGGVYRLEARPGAFLESAPASVSVQADDAPFATIYELLRGSCEEVPADAPD